MIILVVKWKTNDDDRDCQRLRVNKRDHDVPRPLSNWKTFVEMCQTSGVHQQPTDPGVSHTAVVSDEPAATSLSKIHIFSTLS